jgi:16S rRNA (guanine(966)-N(2))-methyltransferase RsmD
LKPSHQKNKQAHNQVRINAGVWRSRLLKFPDAEGLRPTPERVRQTVFNWLGQDMTGKTCLDLFAGTGAFGFEALSRNARSVVMVEYARTAFQSLMQNKILLNAAQATIVQQDALLFLQQSSTPFDVIFCDPPYQKGWFTQILPLLSRHLSPNGVVYAEAEYALLPAEDWQIVKQSKAGNVYYHLLKYQPSL